MELKERIIEEASHLFFQKGIKSVTMSDIACHLGISKRTLYENFRDKEDLLSICLAVQMEQTAAEMKNLIKTSENTIDAMMRIYAKQLNNVCEFNKSALYDLKKYHPRLYENIDSKQHENVSIFLPLFKRGIEQGLVRDDLNCEVLLWLLKAQFKMLMENFMPTDKFPIEQFFEAIILNFTRGIATKKGNDMIDERLDRIKRH
jgi:AcrR family transcriptional regulator